MIKSEQNTFTFSQDIEQNWTCKHKVGHCDLTLLCIFFNFHNFEYQGSINVSVKLITNYV